jgi:hypothetical protein
MEELEKIDLIRSRTGASYKEARAALEAAGGDVVQALIRLEEAEGKFTEKIQNRSQEFIGQFRELLHKGRETRIKVKQGDRTVFEFPASIGALGLLGVLASSELAILGALGTAAAMAKKYTLEIEKAGEKDEGGQQKL